jgi:hypothetical protein
VRQQISRRMCSSYAYCSGSGLHRVVGLSAPAAMRLATNPFNLPPAVRACQGLAGPRSVRRALSLRQTAAVNVP